MGALMQDGFRELIKLRAGFTAIALLLATIVRHGLAGTLPQIEVIGFLVLAMIWFALAVACTPEAVVGDPAA